MGRDLASPGLLRAVGTPREPDEQQHRRPGTRPIPRHLRAARRARERPPGARTFAPAQDPTAQVLQQDVGRLLVGSRHRSPGLRRAPVRARCSRTWATAPPCSRKLRKRALPTRPRSTRMRDLRVQPKAGPGGCWREKSSWGPPEGSHAGLADGCGLGSWRTPRSVDAVFKWHRLPSQF